MSSCLCTGKSTLQFHLLARCHRKYQNRTKWNEIHISVPYLNSSVKTMYWEIPALIKRFLFFLFKQSKTCLATESTFTLQSFSHWRQKSRVFIPDQSDLLPDYFFHCYHGKKLDVFTKLCHNLLFNLFIFNPKLTGSSMKSFYWKFFESDIVSIL